MSSFTDTFNSFEIAESIVNTSCRDAYLVCDLLLAQRTVCIAEFVDIENHKIIFLYP